MGIGRAMNRAVFLDRDGVLNRAIIRQGKPYPPATLDEFQLYDDVAESLRRLKVAGFRLVVVTNQPDVRTGLQQQSVVEAMHERLRHTLPLDDIRVCYHVDADECDCRKPKPGMLLAAAQQAEIDLACSFLVGDRWRDIDAGRAAGCKTIWIQTEYQERRPDHADARVKTLTEATDWILQNAALVARGPWSLKPHGAN